MGNLYRKKPTYYSPKSKENRETEGARGIGPSTVTGKLDHGAEKTSQRERRGPESKGRKICGKLRKSRNQIEKRKN